MVEQEGKTLGYLLW